MEKTLALLLLRLVAWITMVMALSSNSALDDERTLSWSKCERVPPGIHAPRSPGSNGFAVKISGNPEYYVPGERYTISLHGYRSPNEVHKFTSFMLVAESKNKTWFEDSISPVRHGIGSFQLYGDALTMFSGSCPHAIVHTTFVLKAEIQVMWQAPRSGSGCVIFRATVVENRDLWYMDDGELTKELCEQEVSPDHQGAVLDNCCACDEAKYELTFEGLWSRHTHPRDFPHGHRTHFSDIIGSSHSTDYRLWSYDGYASKGVQEVAELGETKILESELKDQSQKIRTIIKARGLYFPNVTEKTFAVFRVDTQHHVMSMLSMLGPSPDWIVGVSALELCLSNCSWLNEKVMNLYPWDAGIDDGISYTSSKSPTKPQEKIRKITSAMPDNPESPFYDPTGQPMKPVARLIVTRQRVYEKSCENEDTHERHNKGICSLPKVIGSCHGYYLRWHYDEIQRNCLQFVYSGCKGNSNNFEKYEICRDTCMHEEASCAVTEWSQFSPCSVSCGHGVRTRTRSYVNELKTLHNNCKVKLVDKESCKEKCVGDISCQTTDWGDWTPCSATCGRGYRERRRSYINPKARSVCDDTLKNDQMCVGNMPGCTDTELDNLCSVTEWTEWTPCTATCDKGVMYRNRKYTNPLAMKHCNLEVTQTAPCTGSMAECPKDKGICFLPKVIGPCRGYNQRWYYNETQNRCLLFVYGGCKGNNNNFLNYEQCSAVCEQEEGTEVSPSPLPYSVEPPGSRDKPAIDCYMTHWSAWSTCSSTCNSGRRERRRQIQVHPQNGGIPCPPKLFQRRRCKENPTCPVDCGMTPWSVWSPCSVTCGDDGVQMRTREVKRVPTLGGRTCGAVQEKRYCNLAPCA